MLPILAVITTIAVTLSVDIPSIFADPVLEPYTFTENFEHGAVGPWAAYPPSQDTAYDPSIRVLPLLNEKDADNRALTREITPNYDIDYDFGVRKLLDMYVDETSVLTFRVYVKSYRGTSGIKVRLGFGDGEMAEKLLPFSEIGTWHDCRLDFSEIMSSGETKKLDAAAFMAVCPNADPETLLRFRLDDVGITGYRERHWRFSEPAVHKLEEWPDFITGKHYTEGGSITISGMSPVESTKISVRVSRALTGADTRTFSMKKRSGRWSRTIPLNTSKKGLAPGLWRAQISSTVKNGDSFSTSLVFLVRRGDAPTGHPSLYYSQRDVKRIMAKTASGHTKTVWDTIRNSANRARRDHDIEDFNYKFDVFNEVHWLPVFGNFGSELRTPQDYIRDNAVVYGMSNDSEAGKAARDALLKVTEWPSYVPPHILNQGKHSYYITGLFLTDLALGYDILHGLYTPDERTTVAGSLYSKGVKAVYEEYVKGNWVSSNTSNWICDVTAGSILCSMAIYEDYGPEKLEPYLTGSILKLGEIAHDAFDEDGCYGEGSLYYMHTLHGLTKSMAVLERAFDIRFPEKIARSHYFLLYQLDPETKRIYTFGDSYENLMGFGSSSYLGMGNAVYLLKKYRDPYLKWLYDFNPGTTERDLFFADDSIESKSPDDLPKVKLFRDIGTTVFRSGFGHDDFMFVFRCGAFVNHQHFDQGAFFLADRGEEFLGEIGRSGYYTDLWYQKLITQPGGHNCILVDGNPESQIHGDFLHDVPAWKNYASTTDFFEFDGGAFVSGRLDPLYGGKMRNLRRNILYLEPRTVVLIDEFEAEEGVETVDLRFHAPVMEDISVSDGDTLAYITRPGGILTIRNAGPESINATIFRRPMTLREISDRRPENMKKRGFLQLSVPTNKVGKKSTVVNVLSTDSALMDSLFTNQISDSYRMRIGGWHCIIRTDFSHRLSGSTLDTDALIFLAGEDHVTFLRVTYMKNRDSTVDFSADEPVNYEYHHKKRLLKISRLSGNSGKIFVGTVFGTVSKPENILLDGKKFRDWTYEKDRGITINNPPAGWTYEIQTGN